MLCGRVGCYRWGLLPSSLGRSLLLLGRVLVWSCGLRRRRIVEAMLGRGRGSILGSSFREGCLGCRFGLRGGIGCERGMRRRGLCQPL